MKKTLIALIAILAFPFMLNLVTAAPAHAGKLCDTTGICGTVHHYAPDNGRDTPIPVRCKYGDPSSTRYVAEGKTSTCKDVDQVKVRKGEELHILKFFKGEPYWTKWHDATGWYKVDDTFNGRLLVQAD
jgi:hypothetical protein